MRLTHIFFVYVGGQWTRTRRGWRLSESETEVENQSPSKTQVENLLEKHVQKQSHKQMLETAEGIKGAPRKFCCESFKS